MQAIKVAVEKKDPTIIKRKRQKEDKAAVSFHPFSPQPADDDKDEVCA